MSKIEVDTIAPQSGTQVTLGESGDTITIPAGATFDASSGTLTLADGSVTNAKLANSSITINGSSVSLGGSTTIETGTSWQSVVTASTLTTVAGNGYPINTTSNACTVTLPGSASAGDQVQIVDYAGTFATNNITLTSSLNIEGGTSNKILTTNREGVTITYVDVTQGWVATSGVNSGDQAIDPVIYSADFLVIAGGGGSSTTTTGNGGGGGAGGYRNSFSTETSGGGGSSEASLTFTGGTVYTITVGAGGSPLNNGSNSVISGTGITTITSVGGGRAGYYDGVSGAAGGSGGGGGQTSGAGGSGTANQGYAGGTNSNVGGSGGGGAGGVGQNCTSAVAGNGGAGLASSITGSSVSRAGGGGGSNHGSAGSQGGIATAGGGNGRYLTTSAQPGTANTGGGGGGFGENSGSTTSGGSGVVILSMPDANYSGTTTGSPTVATGVSGKTVLTFTGSGTYTG